jgi:hypothetical protein
MPGFSGFDRFDYPGDAIMSWLKANTNLVWCGYYLAPAPSHPNTSWMTTRANLAGNGWGIAPIFVGQQVTGPGSLNPSAATGIADGHAAVGLMKSEGFVARCCVYLDIENGPPLTAKQQDYVANWCDTVSAAAFTPGVYCSHLLALTVHTIRSNCRVWAYNVPTTQSHPVPGPYPDPDPSGCGYPDAFAWQLGQNCMIRAPLENLQTLEVDLGTALVADPSAP